MASLLSFGSSSSSLHFTKWRPINTRTHLLLPTFLPKFPSPTINHSTGSSKRLFSSLTPKASVSSVDYVVEPATDVKFEKELAVPGCSDSLILLGTGYREKVYAIIGVKVYAAAFYAKYPVRDALESWKGKSADEVLEDPSLFSSIFHGITNINLKYLLERKKYPSDLRTILQHLWRNLLKIMLVRDVDGKTFWNALNDVISPRIKEPAAVDESALSTFRNAFHDRDLKKGTLIILTWIEPSKMLVSISSDGFPTNIDAEINSVNVTLALFDGFFGESPVSPTLKASVANGLSEVLE